MYMSFFFFSPLIGVGYGWLGPSVNGKTTNHVSKIFQMRKLSKSNKSKLLFCPR